MEERAPAFRKVESEVTRIRGLRRGARLVLGALKGMPPNYPTSLCIWGLRSGDQVAVGQTGTGSAMLSQKLWVLLSPVAEALLAPTQKPLLLLTSGHSIRALGLLCVN